MKSHIYEQFAFRYDEIYGDKFYHDYAVFIKKIIKKNNIKNVRILDIACGTGKLIKEFTKEYIEIDKIEGLDSSREMIKIAKSRNKGIKFYNQNLINFYTEKKYNIITCTFDSINYITSKENLDKVFKNIANHLDSNGLFIFDFNTIYKKVKEIITKDNVTYINAIKGKYWNIKIRMKERNNIYKEQHRERLYSLREIKSVLVKNRFEITELYSNFDNKINKTDKYQRLIIVAKKI